MDFNILSFSSVVLAFAFFIAGVIDAVCGGGGLITLPAMISIGIPVHNVTPTNQCAASFGAVVAFWRYLKNGKIYWPAALIATPTAIIGSYFGARLNQIVPESILKIIMVVLIPVVAIFVFIKKDSDDISRPESLSKSSLIMRSLFIGLIIGGYQGFYGAGSGAFFLLAFNLLIRLDLITASGCSKPVLMCAVLTASVTYIFTATVYWSMVLVGGVFNMAGNYVGAGLALTKGARIIKPVFLVIIVVLVVKLALEIL